MAIAAIESLLNATMDGMSLAHQVASLLLHMALTDSELQLRIPTAMPTIQNHT